MSRSAGVAGAVLGSLPTVLTAAPALVAAGLGIWLSGNHPLWPSALRISFVVWSLAVAGWPRLWLLLVPAALPILNFLPWSGWLIFEEFDLMLLGVLAGGYARLALLGRGSLIQGRDPTGTLFARSERLCTRERAWGGLLLCLAGSALLALWRGVADAGGWSFGWFDGYSAPLNSVRVFKSLAYAVLVVPLIRDGMGRQPERAIQSVASGVLAGLALVSLAVLWERFAFPGLFDFSSRYRTTALFWEMHVGGAAIDAYLAMSVPFLVWALVSARRLAVWAAIAALTVAAVYAVLTTFSRGVYLAVAVPLAGLAMLVAARYRGATRLGAVGQPAAVAERVRPPVWKGVGSALLAIVLLTEVATVLLAGTYMGERLGVADRDLAKRLTHWRHGLALLSTPVDWFLGIGLGRLPSHYARQVNGGEFSGEVAWRQEPVPAPPVGQSAVTGFARLQGPATNPLLAGWYGLARRVELRRGQVYRVGLDLRASADTEIAVRVCERHLLFDAACQYGKLPIGPTSGAWQQHSVTLVGPPLSQGFWWAPKLGLLSLSVLQAGASVDLAKISLGASTQTESVTVGDFSRGLSQWFAVAQVHFLPWHIDNLYLELLIERGWLGLLLMLAVLTAGLGAAMRKAGQGSLLAGSLAAGMAGGLLVGAWGSIMDAPRVAFLLFLLTICAMAWGRGSNSH